MLIRNILDARGFFRHTLGRALPG